MNKLGLAFGAIRFVSVLLLEEGRKPVLRPGRCQAGDLEAIE
ncbi:MAG TPA: hypothetical protein VJ437_14045 [Acidiferrobacterales bacterium]|nr:hypothetical protein [Acidiferrobacterales bacterium]